MLAHQLGFRLPIKAAYGMWVWEKLWKEATKIDYQEFCRRGQLRPKSGAARAGMPEGVHGPATSWPPE
jgi:hypothetical protein